MAHAGIMSDARPTFYEFFAGGGMARAGLGDGWNCLFANDFSPMKVAAYRENWGSEHLVWGDVAKVNASELPGRADLAWASFPCQDLSLAGNYLGIGKAAAEVMTRSGTFWPFWALMKTLKADGRAPRLIVLENVPGLLTSRDGADFQSLCAALSAAGYRYGAVVMDAREFVPQSRQRVFFVAVASDVPVNPAVLSTEPTAFWHSAALRTVQSTLKGASKKQWLWWKMPQPPARNTGFADLIEEHPTGCRWHSAAETKRLLGMMTTLNRAKITMAQKSGRTQVGGVYKRTRLDEQGVKRQRAEVRFDDLSGCLRTPAGGSSRQTIVVVDGASIRSRLLSPREAARLMGLEDDYKLPARYNDAYHVAGDGVCVPAVRYLAEQILEPLLAFAQHDPQSLAA